MKHAIYDKFYFFFLSWIASEKYEKFCFELQKWIGTDQN
jgi:hypothetical protein